jgi:hypothetical protein
MEFTGSFNHFSHKQQEREKARQLLKEPQQQQQQKQQPSNKSASNFDWSDLKLEKTQFFDKTPNRSNPKQILSPFEHTEISARSTAIQHGGGIKNALDFDTLMKSSISTAVQDRYRQSMASGRLSVMSKNYGHHQRMDWDERSSQQSFSSLAGKNLTFSNEDFRPAEEMASQLDEDERMHDMEFAVIPRGKKGETFTKVNVSNWEENLTLGRQPEMSFGQYCAKNVKSHNIRDIYTSKSPPKRQNREALVDLNTNETLAEKDRSQSSLLDSINLEDLISKW